MTTIRRNPLLAIANASIWIVAFASWTADWALAPMPHMVERTLLRVPLALLGFSLCWGYALAMRRARDVALPARIGLGAAFVGGMSLLQAAASQLLFSGIVSYWNPYSLSDFLQQAMSVGWVFFAWAALFGTITGFADRSDAELRISSARADAMKAERQALARQLSPHFLFNALNAISGLILEKDNERAERMLSSLSRLLRKMLSLESRELIPLGEEIEAARNYIEIERARFEGRFDFTVVVAREAERKLVPPMLLQPLLENAIKHGVAQSREHVDIRLAIALEPMRLRIALVDDARRVAGCEAGARPADGIGHMLVRKRLDMMYQDRASFIAAPREPSGYAIMISLPARDA